MMRSKRLFLRDARGSAATEMALVLPVMLMLMLGSAEAGNYFMNEHSLVKAVRDGARFAARQNFSNYTACSGSPGGTVVTDTTNLVRKGYLSGGTIITPNIQTTDVTVNTSCTATAGGQQLLGIYQSRFGGTCNGSSANGCAQRVTVSATVDYRSVLGAFGLGNLGLKLNASSQAAVTGV